MSNEQRTPIETTTENVTLYKLHVELKGTHVPVWRDIVVESNTPLIELAFIIQGAMGWKGMPLFQFVIDDRAYPVFNDDKKDEKGLSDSFFSNSAKGSINLRLPFDSVLGTVKEFIFLYSFRGVWQHKITVESVECNGQLSCVPYCLAGEGACPPDNLYGVVKYKVMCELLNDPKFSGKLQIREWLRDWGFRAPRKYPPEFDLKKVNDIFIKASKDKYDWNSDNESDEFDDGNNEGDLEEDTFDDFDENLNPFTDCDEDLESQNEQEDEDSPCHGILLGGVDGVNIFDLSEVDLDDLETIRKLLPMNVSDPQSMTHEQIQQYVQDTPAMSQLFHALKDMQKKQIAKMFESIHPSNKKKMGQKTKKTKKLARRKKCSKNKKCKTDKKKASTE